MVLPDHDAGRLAGRCIGAVDAAPSSGALAPGFGTPFSGKRTFALTDAFQSRTRGKGGILNRLPIVATLDTLTEETFERRREALAQERILPAHQGPPMALPVRGAWPAKLSMPSPSATSGEYIPCELQPGFMGVLAGPCGSSDRGYNYQASSNGESVTAASRHLILQQAAQSAARADPRFTREAICERPQDH